jgi:very-short-patch-repair endonuclease
VGGDKGEGEMTDSLTKFAKNLRKNSTDAEVLLWQRLRARQLNGIKFRRQQPCKNFILDFLSFEKRLIIELDGGQHAQERHKDIERDRFLSENGFRVLRFWNNEVLKNIDGVLEVIRESCLK